MMWIERQTHRICLASVMQWMEQLPPAQADFTIVKPKITVWKWGRIRENGDIMPPHISVLWPGAPIVPGDQPILLGVN